MTSAFRGVSALVAAILAALWLSRPAGDSPADRAEDAGVVAGVAHAV